MDSKNSSPTISCCVRIWGESSQPPGRGPHQSPNVLDAALRPLASGNMGSVLFRRTQPGFLLMSAKLRQSPISLFLTCSKRTREHLRYILSKVKHRERGCINYEVTEKENPWLKYKSILPQAVRVLSGAGHLIYIFSSPRNPLKIISPGKGLLS